MNAIIKRIAAILIIGSTIVGCKKEAFNGLSDVRPPIPVTVTNAIDYRSDPTVGASKSAGGNIQIVLAIPSGSGRTIKEITKIAASTTYTAIQSTGSSGFYTSAPIVVNNTTATFNTTLAEYVTKGPGVIPSATNNELAKRFYFLLTLDDGSIIIPQPVRVLYLD
jgi:hypothetical protein